MQNATRLVTLPALAQSFTTIPYQNSQQQVRNTFNNPPTLAAIYGLPVCVPQARRRPDHDGTSTGRPNLQRLSPPRPFGWRIREIERQQEMDRIAVPYFARLREVSRQKKSEAEARALVGNQKADRASGEQGESWWHFFWADKKVQKERTKAERQQRSEERRQTRNRSLDKNRRNKSGESTQPEGLEQEAPASPRRKNAGRSKPYSVPHAATRSHRLSQIMPGGFNFDEPAPCHQTGIFPDSDSLWKGLRFFVDVGYRLWTQD